MNSLFRIYINFTRPSSALLDIISTSFSALTDLLAIAITVYIFSEALIQKKLDDDVLLSKLLGILRKRQRKRLYIAIIIYLFVFLLLFYCKAKGTCNSLCFVISHVLVLIDTFYIIWSIYNCISLDRDTKEIAQSEFELVTDSITSLLDDQINLNNSQNEYFVGFLNDWYAGEKWNDISYETYISRFSVVEKLIKNHEDFESPKLFEEDLERRISDRFSKNSELERKNFIERIASKYEVAFSTAEDYIFVVDVICPLISHSMYSVMYSKLAHYRDLLRYFVSQGKKQNSPHSKSIKSVKNISKKEVNILFNIFMLKTFSDYCSFMNLYNYNNDYGKFKYSCLYDCSLNHAYLKTIKLEESYLVRSNVVDSYLNNSLVLKSLWFNTRFENSNLENNIYDCAVIINCFIAKCEVSFSKFERCKLEYVSFQNMICQQFEINRSHLNRISGLNLNIQHLTMVVSSVSNSVFSSVHINKFSLQSENTYDESKWNERLIKTLNSLNEDTIYKIIILGDKLKDNIHTFLKLFQKSSVWKYICTNILIDINGISFVDGSILNSKKLSCIDMSNSNFKNSDFTDIIIEKSNMSGMCGDNGKYKNVEMSYIMAAESTLINANLYNSAWNVVNFYDSLLEGINATNSKFTHCIFDESNCNNVIWANVSAALCSFKFVKLKKTDWSNSTLDVCEFESCDMSDSFFAKAKIINCQFEYNDLREFVVYKSRFDKCVLQNNMLKNAILRHVHFDNCWLESNYFGQCEIDDVSLTNTTVINPDLTTLEFLQRSQLNHVRLVIWNHAIEIDEHNSKMIIARILSFLKSFASV